MDAAAHVPPGFRFHPTDEELVNYYLRKKIASRRIDLDVIKDVDLYKIEPSDLQEICKIGDEEQHDWYFFSHKDKKYPTGTRTNRATTTGFWKATGRDKPIYLKHKLIGMRKTLVFYRGRAPNGQKSDWIMHEYRLESDQNEIPQEEGWVVCRAFKKRALSIRKGSEFDHDEPPCWYHDNLPLMPSIESHWNVMNCPNLLYNHKDQMFQSVNPYEPNLHLPQLHSPKLHLNAALPRDKQLSHDEINTVSFQNSTTKNDQVIDWRVLDKFVASQLSQDGISNDSNGRNPNDNLQMTI